MTTIDYTGASMAGNVSVLDVGSFVPTSTNITGFYTAEVVLNGSSLVSYSAAFNASNGMTFGMPTGSFGGGFVDTGPSMGPGLTWNGPSGNVLTVNTDAAGNITGATFGFDFTIYHDQSSTFHLGAGSDTFSYVADHGPMGNGTCANAWNGGYMLCGATAAGTGTGTWTAHEVPEIGASGAVGALMLLAGVLAVLRGRRHG